MKPNPLIKKAPPKLLMAFDPGKDTGVCLFQDGHVVDMDILRGIGALQDFLINSTKKPDLIVIEEFALRKTKALQQSGSHMETSQVIGMIKLWARQNNIPVVTQPANALPMGLMWGKLKMPKNHRNSHWISARAHGIYYMVANGMMEPLV